MLTTILTAIPLWVWPLLAGLTLLGLRATRDRRAPVILIYALPFLGLMSLSRALGLPASEAALTALLLAFLIGAGLGWWAQPRWTIARDTRHVTLRGEWVTLPTLLGLFAINFGMGMAQGMAPAIVADPVTAAAFGALAGLLSGSLAGRALRIAAMRAA